MLAFEMQQPQSLAWPFLDPNRARGAHVDVADGCVAENGAPGEKGAPGIVFDSARLFFPSRFAMSNSVREQGLSLP
jgi:hypothetical protein